MKILNETNTKNIQNQTDVTIGIVEEKDDIPKFKFKRPLMLKIFIPLSIFTLTSLLICLLTLTDNYEIIIDETSNLEEDHLRNVLSRNYNNRHKRQLGTCVDCNEKKELEFLENVLRCKKNLENNQECCDLYKKVKELNKVMEDVQKEFNLLKVPCGPHNQLESGEKKSSSSSSSSSSEKKEEKIKNVDENTAQEEEDEENHQNIEYFDKNKETEAVHYNDNTFYKQIHQNPDIIIYQPEDNNITNIQDYNMETTTYNNMNNYEIPSKDINENNDNYDTNYRDTIPLKYDNYKETYLNPSANIAQQTTQNIVEDTKYSPIYSSQDHPENTKHIQDYNQQQDLHNNHDNNNNYYESNNYDYNNNPEESYDRNSYIQNVPDNLTPQEKLVEEYTPTEEAQNKEKFVDNHDYDIDMYYQVKNDEYKNPNEENITETNIQNNFDYEDKKVDQTTSINEEIHNTNVDFNVHNYYDQQITTKGTYNTKVYFNTDNYYEQQNTYNQYISQEEYAQNIPEDKIDTSTNSSFVEQYFDGNISVQIIENTTDSTTIQYEDYNKNIEDTNKEEHTTIFSENTTKYSPKAEEVFYNHFDNNYDINVKIKVNEETPSTIKYDYEDNSNKYFQENYNNAHYNNEDKYPNKNLSQDHVDPSFVYNSPEETSTTKQTTENNDEYYIANTSNQEEYSNTSNTKVFENIDDNMDLLEQLRKMNVTVYSKDDKVPNNKETEAQGIVVQPNNLYEEEKTNNNNDNDFNNEEHTNNYNNEYTNKEQLNYEYGAAEDANLNEEYIDNIYNAEEHTDNFYNNEKQIDNHEYTNKQQLNNGFSIAEDDDTINKESNNYNHPEEDQNINKEYNGNDKQIYNSYSNEYTYKQQSYDKPEAQNAEDINIHEDNAYEITADSKPTIISENIEETTPQYINHYQPENNNYYDMTNMEIDSQNPTLATEDSTALHEDQMQINEEYEENAEQIYNINNNKESNVEQEAENEEDMNIRINMHEDNSYETTTETNYFQETIPPQLNYYQPENNNYYDLTNLANEESTTLYGEDQNINNNEYNKNIDISEEQIYNTNNNEDLYKQKTYGEQQHVDNNYETTTNNIYNKEEHSDNFYNNEKQIDHNNYDTKNKGLYIYDYKEENQNLNKENEENNEQINNNDNIYKQESYVEQQTQNNKDMNTNMNVHIDNIYETTTNIYNDNHHNNEKHEEDINNSKNEDVNYETTTISSKLIEEITTPYYDMKNIDSDSLYLRSTTEATTTLHEEHIPKYSYENQDYEIDFRLKIEENSTSTPTTQNSYYDKAKFYDYPDEMDLETVRNLGQNMKHGGNIEDSNSEDYYTDSQGKIEELGQSEENILLPEKNMKYEEANKNQNDLNEELTTTKNEYETENSEYFNNKEVNNYEEKKYDEYAITSTPESNYDSELSQEKVNEYSLNEPQITKKKIEVTNEQPDQIYQKAASYNMDLNLDQDPNLKLNIENHETDNSTKDENMSPTNNSDPNLQETNTNFFLPLEDTTVAQNEVNSRFHSESQPRIQDNNGDIRIVNQNPIPQRFQNTGVSSKFDNIFQLPPIETSKASQQLTVNTNMLPMCFYGFPGNNGPMLRQPGYDSQINPFSMAHTYGAFGYPQMFPNSLGQQSMYNYYNSLIGQQKLSQSNIFNQSPYNTNPYFCTYVPSSSLQFPPVSGIQEFRNTEKKITPPEDLDDKTIPKDWIPTLINSNKSRNSINCLPHEKSCFDGIQCIKSSLWCDGIVQCNDKSDELGCPCKTRVDKSRLCDGYFDCPNGEDELGCFGCTATEFSCDDWSDRQKTATCVPLQQRCDGIPQCKTAKDEMDCSLLTNSINVHQTYAVSKSSGYLHRNFKGNWYPVCSNSDTWALDACLAEVGPQTTFPLIQMLPIPNDYSGEFLSSLPDKKMEFLKSCVNGEAIYVICPPIPCGTRLLPPHNHFRKHEVDTSAEEDFFPFVSRLRRFTEELHKINQHPSILSSNDFIDKNKHHTLEKMNQHIDIANDTEWSFEEQERLKRGENRVVGGKPSQPTSWPWVVAIYRDGIFHCGGVLMSELWVITAAHCVDTYWQHYFEVQAGMLRRFSFSPMEQNRVVGHVIGHQMYDRSDMKNDLALLKVSAPFQFNRWVRPVCLPSESSAGPKWMWGPEPGTICTAVGWGATIEHGPDPDHMREVDVPILPQCKHREDQEGQEICAGYLEGGRDACQGDSGGPLLCRNPLAPSQWYVAGIVSHGEGCARPNEPGAYTRVSLYLNWIARSILEESLPKRKPIQKCPGTLCIGTHRCISKKRKCDKTVDCLVGDDEINCPKTDYSSLIKHAFDNMLLFASHNVTNNTQFAVNFNETRTDEQYIHLHNDNEMNDEKNVFENNNSTINSFKNSEQSFMNKTDPNTTISEIELIISDPSITEDITESTHKEDTTNSLDSLTSNDPNTNTDRSSFTEEDIKIITQTFHAMNNENFIPANNKTNIPVYFECRKILQLIPMSRRCDKIIDCEDGTDEIRCSCRGYLYSSHPNAICDGVVDCFDGSDEANCINCPPSYFHCHLSEHCIPEALQCNHVPNCLFGEDEWDCFALTNDTYIRYDTDDRPELRSKGVMSFSFSGKWFPLCSNNWFQTAHDVAGDMCAYLGFSGFQKFLEIQIKQTSLQILSHNETSLTLSHANETCRGLYVKCSTSLSDTGDMKKIYTAHQNGANTFKEVLMSPWNAAIFVDGVYMCSGTLIEKNWVITSRICLHIDLHRNYTTVVFGAGRGQMNVMGPHEQIRLVSELVQILLTDVALLRLEKPVTFTRYVRPLYIRHMGNDIVSERETCTVLGKENDSFMQVVVLKPYLQKCLRGKRCFKRITPLGNCDVETPSWSGTIVCLSEIGWYPAAVYFDQKGSCGFLTTVEYTSIRSIKVRIINAMNKQEFPIKPPVCNGVRCPLGQCVTANRLCNGIPDCRDGSDETKEVCEEKRRKCEDSKNCECAPSELRCHNSKCVPKSAFCDRVNDCGDWSDEPARCNCSSYLSLVAPHRLCDGVFNCLDKSDENPRVCGCRDDSFKCEKSGLCIPNEWVCDGDTDCPQKEDELVCLALRKPEGERDGAGEVVLRSYGVWHSYCLRGNVLSPPDLEDICRELGYSTAHAAAVNGSFTRPAQDIAEENFSLVRFNKYVMMFLKGDYPMAKLLKNEECERLYIECTPP